MLRALSPRHIYQQLIKEPSATSFSLSPFLGAEQVLLDQIAAVSTDYIEPSSLPQQDAPTNSKVYLPIELYPQNNPYYTPTPVRVDDEG